ncbi:MAG: precorrin-6y C5,15-methyltransferase (decarboxylating) subunit CbiE [Nitrospirota bacterium]|nr:precorrin-6y C5,15-methyltransferase (decarboxylating) subunit CbiE [Nitrospirota bacterium]
MNPTSEASPNSLIRVIGIGSGARAGICPGHAETILGAELLIASREHQELFPEFPGKRLAITSNMQEVTATCKAALGKFRVVVLGSGDPNFFGIGRYLISQLGAASVRIEPAASFMQTAFARAGLPWHEAALGSVHGKPIEIASALARHHPIVGLFTDPDNTPQAVARHLISTGFKGVTCHVVSRIGHPDEQIKSANLEETAGQTFPEPNVLILVHREPPRRRLVLGLPEETFVHRKPKAGLITRREVRALAVANLHLAEDSVVWDIGAGSGSVAVECALFATQGHVYAIEKNAEDVQNICANVTAFGVLNVSPVHATAPEGLADLADPDAVFIGGTGGQMGYLLNEVLPRLKPGGRLVLTFATLENQAQAQAWFKERGIPMEITQIQVSRGVPILDLTRLEAQNPVTLMAITRPQVDPNTA